jgi:esterase/lipase
VTSRATFKQYRRSGAVTEFRRFEHRGHSLTVDSGWKEIAQAVLQWLGEHGL